MPYTDWNGSRTAGLAHSRSPSDAQARRKRRRGPDENHAGLENIAGVQTRIAQGSPGSRRDRAGGGSSSQETRTTSETSTIAPPGGMPPALDFSGHFPKNRRRAAGATPARADGRFLPRYADSRLTPRFLCSQDDLRDLPPPPDAGSAGSCALRQKTTTRRSRAVTSRCLRYWGSAWRDVRCWGSTWATGDARWDFSMQGPCPQTRVLRAFEGEELARCTGDLC